MRVHAWDSVFVRARRVDVHPLLRDVAAHPTWWPGVTVLARGGDAARVTLRPPGGVASRLRLDVRVTSVREPDKGVHLAYRGDLDGSAEWYYLDEPDGTVVSHILDADASRSARRRLARYRASVRAGMHALKDLLEAGREPGAEPEEALLAHQRVAALQLRPRARGAMARPDVDDVGTGPVDGTEPTP